MQLRLEQWGESLAVRIPPSFLDQSKLEKDALIDLTMENGTIVIHPVAIGKMPTLDELLTQMKPENMHGEVDWGPPVGKEVW